MAIYHLHADIVKRSQGKTVIASAAYISGTTLKHREKNKTFNYSKKPGVVLSEILTPLSDMPEWAYNREDLWNQVEEFEKRKDSQLARTVEVALPRELNLKQQQILLREYLTNNFIKHGLIADYSIHIENTDNHEEANPHAHIQTTMRSVEGGSFKKDKTELRKLNSKEHLLQLRRDWADCVNKHLDQAGFPDVKIDHRSNKERGLTLIPTLHMGPRVAYAKKQGVKLEIALRNERIKSHNRDIQNLQNLRNNQNLAFLNSHKIADHEEITTQNTEQEIGYPTSRLK